MILPPEQIKEILEHCVTKHVVIRVIDLKDTLEAAERRAATAEADARYQLAMEVMKCLGDLGVVAVMSQDKIVEALRVAIPAYGDKRAATAYMDAHSLIEIGSESYLMAIRDAGNCADDQEIVDSDIIANEIRKLAPASSRLRSEIAEAKRIAEALKWFYEWHGRHVGPCEVCDRYVATNVHIATLESQLTSLQAELNKLENKT